MKNIDINLFNPYGMIATVVHTDKRIYIDTDNELVKNEITLYLLILWCKLRLKYKGIYTIKEIDNKTLLIASRLYGHKNTITKWRELIRLRK